MSTYHVIEIGYIPKGCGETYITCGDAESFGGQSVVFAVDEDTGEVGPFVGEVTDPVGTGDLYDRDSELWQKLFTQVLLPAIPAAQSMQAGALGDLWALCMEEYEDEITQFSLISEGDAGGEFLNTDGNYDGHFYARYQYCEDDEFYSDNDRIVVFEI